MSFLQAVGGAFGEHHRRIVPVRRKISLKLVGASTAGIALTAVLIFAAAAYFTGPAPVPPFFEDAQGVWVIAHRGGLGLWPEETLYAFKAALRLGVDVIEFDLHRSRDGVPVVIHDATLDRTTDGTGAVSEFTAAELKAFDAAYRWSPGGDRTVPLRGRGIQIPTLAEVFTQLPKTRMNIEIKEEDASFVESVCACIRKHGRTDQVLVASFSRGVLKRFRSVCPEVATSAGFAEVQLFHSLQKLGLGVFYRPSAQALQVPESFSAKRLVTPDFIRAAHDRNLKVHVWTVNEVDGMRRLLRMSVDGIITDYPDRLLHLLGRTGPDTDPARPLGGATGR
jgi:glycerophosphoryl diester phosphodiesterase